MLTFLQLALQNTTPQGVLKGGKGVEQALCLMYSRACTDLAPRLSGTSLPMKSEGVLPIVRQLCPCFTSTYSYESAML